MSSMAVANKPSKKQNAQKKNAPQSAGAAFDLPEYLRGVKSEWHKVSWPTWPHLWGQVIVVVIMVAIMTAGLWAIDKIFRIAISLLPGTSL